MQNTKNKYIYSEQYKYWNKKNGNKWIKYDANINYKFKHITDILFNNLNINKSDIILDVGCGSGFTTKICADKVGSKGRIVGVDFSLPLINLLQKKFKKCKNIISKQADIESFKLESNKFDFIISRFGVMFFYNPTKAFLNLYNCLKKNGKIGFVCWTDFNYNQFFSLPMHAVTTVTGIKKARLTKKPGPFSFSNINYLKKILCDCNFKDIKIITIKTLLPAEEIKLDVNMLTSLGVAASIIKEYKIPDNQVKIIKKFTYDLFYKKIHNNRNVFKAKFFLVTARK